MRGGGTFFRLNLKSKTAYKEAQSDLDGQVAHVDTKSRQGLGNRGLFLSVDLQVQLWLLETNGLKRAIHM